MRKYDNFINCLNVLRKADFGFAYENDLYRTGVIGQFNMTFELAWKTLQPVLSFQGFDSYAKGSPREVLQMAYKSGLIDDSEVWLQMLTKRNLVTHIYDEDVADELMILIRDSFIPAFDKLAVVLVSEISKMNE